MLLLIHERDRWDFPPAPEPEPDPPRRELHLPRLTAGRIKVLLAAALLVAGFVVNGIVSDVLLLTSVVLLWSALSAALPYGLGLKEHHQ